MFSNSFSMRCITKLYTSMDKIGWIELPLEICSSLCRHTHFLQNFITPVGASEKLITVSVACKTYIHVDRASGRSREKKSNFAGFSGANLRKKRPISRKFRGNFRGHFAEKRLVNNGRFRERFPSKFPWKAIGFALICGKFSMKLDALIDLLRLHTAI